MAVHALPERLVPCGSPAEQPIMPRLSCVLSGLFATCLLLAPAAASAAPTVQEFSAGLPVGTHPAAVAAGPDGAVWFTEAGKPATLGRITPDGTVTSMPSGAGSGPAAGIALGADGNLWFTVAGVPGALGRMTPAGKSTTFTAGLAGDGQPADLAAGPDGALWFTELRSGRVSRIALDGTITEGAAAGPAASPQGIVRGTDGALWWSQQVAGGWIVRLDPATGALRTFAPPSAGRPFDLAAGADGAIWFTALAGPGSDDGGEEAGDSAGTGSDGAQGVIGRIAADGTIAEQGLGTTNKPGAIATGPDGALWFTLKGRAALGRVDASGYFGVLPLPAGGSTVDLTTGPDGSLWYTAQGPDRIGRVTLNPSESPPEGLVSGAPGSRGRPLTPVALGPKLPKHGPAGTPDLGRSVAVAARQGTVKIRKPGSGRYVTLDAVGGEVPVGSVVDARRGTVVLRSALDRAGRTQTGSFHGAVFQVRQPHGAKGMTELVLRGGSFAACVPARGAKRGARAATATAAERRTGHRTAKKRHVVRSLWGSDHGGRFRTRGRDSVATVRGTRWRTTDRCDGTLTTVLSGKVAVRDRRTGRTVLVRAGHSHLARHAR
jgi:virginiamycin B lyase